MRELRNRAAAEDADAEEAGFFVHRGEYIAARLDTMSFVSFALEKELNHAHARLDSRKSRNLSQFPPIVDVDHHEPAECRFTSGRLFRNGRADYWSAGNRCGGLRNLVSNKVHRLWKRSSAGDQTAQGCLRDANAAR